MPSLSDGTIKILKLQGRSMQDSAIIKTVNSSFFFFFFELHIELAAHNIYGHLMDFEAMKTASSHNSQEVSYLHAIFTRLINISKAKAWQCFP